MVERALLGIDGNAAYALLGKNLQVGESEWVEIETNAVIGSADWRRVAVAAADLAVQKLRARLPDRKFFYVLDPSHPEYRPPRLPRP